MITLSKNFDGRLYYTKEFFSQAQLHALGGLLPQLKALRLSGCGHYPQHQARDETLAAAIGFIRATLAASPSAEGAAA